MPIITQMFPYIIPQEIQAEIDKQTHLYEGIHNWLENVKQSVLRGEDDYQVFRAPKTPAYRKRKGRRIETIVEENGDHEDTFDVSSSSTRSSFSNSSSTVSCPRIRRTAAVKASIQLKTQVNPSLNSKIRQPVPEVNFDIQSNVVTPSTVQFTSYDRPPIKKMCLERQSTHTGAEVLENDAVVAIDSVKTVFNDSDDIVLSLLKKNSQVKELVPGSNDTGDRDTSMKSTRTRRGNSKARGKRIKENNVLSEEILERPKTSVNKQELSVDKQEPDVCTDNVVEGSLCGDTAVKRTRKDTVSMVLDNMSRLTNDPKFKMKAVVSLSHVSVPALAQKVVVSTDKNVIPAEEDDSENKMKQDTAVADVDVLKTEQSAAVITRHDVVGQDLAAESQNGATVCDPDTMECEVVVADQDVAVAKRTSLSADHECNVEVKEKPRQNSGRRTHSCENAKNVEKPTFESGTEIVTDESNVQVKEKQRQNSNRRTRSWENAKNVVKPVFESGTEIVTSQDSGLTTPNTVTEISSDMQRVELQENSHIADKNGTRPNGTKTVFSADNPDETAKSGGVRRTLRRSVGAQKTAESPSESVLNSTYTSCRGKVSPVALADISNTLNSSANLRDNVLKDPKKTQQVLGLPLTSTPWFAGSPSSGSSLSWNCKVVLSSQKLSSPGDKQERHHKSPVCRSPVIFNPYAKESVKNRVAKFENLNTLMEVVDENTDPSDQQPSARVTRTKTRAMAAAAAAAAAKNAESDTSCDTARKLQNLSSTQSTAKKSLKKALRISAAKCKKGLLTPNTSRDEGRWLNALTSSMKKYNIVVGMNTFLPKMAKTPCLAELEKRKEEDQRRQEERAEEARRKKKNMLTAMALERKRRNEEKVQKVAEKREAQLREEQERRLRLEREKEEKLSRLLQSREEKQREELTARRLQLQQKLLDVDKRRQQEESARLARLLEQEEQEARRKEQLEKERIAEEKAAAREQAMLLKQKVNSTFTSQPGPSKLNKQDCVKMDQTFNLEEVTSYKISDVGANSDDELTIKHAVPKWAKCYRRPESVFREFLAYEYLPVEKVKLYGGLDYPDLTCLLGLTAQQVARCRRKSSIFPARQSGRLQLQLS
ncbi:inner centromere protein A-like isoform X2 [Bacillus rossius redtenbacheri]